MKIVEIARELKEIRAAWGEKTVGFVPTMGALHEGHSRLLEIARQENEVLVLSLFVNPTQFNNQEDLEKYPRTWEADLALASAAGVDLVFAPSEKELYPDGFRFEVREKDLSQRLCGAFRPGHFAGVLTVVMKLFQCVHPTRAYFGEKDFQQLSLIQDMVKSFFLDVHIVPVPTVREADGLAMSSRNRRLSKSGRQRAAALFEGLSVIPQNASFQQIKEIRDILEKKGFEVDYLEQIGGRNFVAASIEGVRLIDNLPAEG